jgi:hypothetical protein
VNAHPSLEPATLRRRQLEFDRAESAYDVAQLQTKWQREDAAAADAEDYRTKEVVDLRQRVAALERLLGPNGRTLISGFAKATGDAIGRVRLEERAHTAAELERRAFMRYGGVWDEAAEYPRGALVTHAGSAWVALTPAEKGLRPGKAPAWRLAIKGEGKMPGIA